MVGRKNYDERLVKIRVPKGAKLTPSKRVPGALSPLVHGKKGVKAQAVVIPVRLRERSRGLLGWLLGFSAKVILAVLALGLALVVASVVLSAALDGVAAGLETVTEAASRAAGYLVVGAAGLALLALVVVVLRAGRSAARRRARERHSAEAATARYPAAQAIPAPSPAPSVAPANWYADPWHAAQLRYWDGSAWTGYVSPRYADPVPAAAPVGPQGPDTQPHRVDSDTRITMSGAEWQRLVRAWVTAGAVEQTLWQRLVHARLTDADPLTLEAQSRMEKLTPELGARRVRLMLEANPRLREELTVRDLLALLLTGAAASQPVTQRRLQPSVGGRADEPSPWLL